MKRLLLLSGWKESGKDYIADILVKNFLFKKISFAEELKNQVSSLYKIDRNLLDTQEGKKMVYKENVTNRQLLIAYGEAKRKDDPFFWAKKVLNKINDNQNTVISDWRFKEEHSFLTKNLPNHEIITIRILRHQINKSLGDPTETSLDNFHFNCMILNDKNNNQSYIVDQLKRILGKIE